MAHDVLVALHALAGVGCFVAGALSLSVSTASTWRYRAYLGSLIGMAGFAAAAVTAGWQARDQVSRAVFVALLVLAGYLVWRGIHAGRQLRDRPGGWRSTYVDDIGFTLIALFEGFAIVAAIDLGAPVWLVVVIAVAGVVAGNLAIRRIKGRLLGAPRSV
jgi:hypothetical protein